MPLPPSDDPDPFARHKAALKARSLRSAPADAQGDLLVPALVDIGARDGRSIMDVAVFRLSKKDRRAGDVIRYELPDGYVQVSAGMASVWDAAVRAGRLGLLRWAVRAAVCRPG